VKRSKGPEKENSGLKPVAHLSLNTAMLEINDSRL
jgi:hypothetical protein